MTTLATGGAGYVGSHTVAALAAAGHDVVILDDFSNARRGVVDALRSLTTRQIEIVEGDACDRATVDAVFDEYRIESVVHFAAHKSVPESVAEPLRYFRNNLMSTLTLAAAAVERQVRRFVFSSSAVVYGTPVALPVTEESPTEPESPYGATKLMCERVLADAASASGMQVVMLRYFNPVGAHPTGTIGEDPPGEATNLISAVMSVAMGTTDKLEIFGCDYPTRDGTAIRDYIHVMDLADGHLAALAADLGERSSRIFNLGTGVPTTVLEVVAAASEAAQRAIPFEIVARRPGDLAASWADCSRAARELGWHARRGLNEMLDDHWRFVSGRTGRLH